MRCTQYLVPVHCYALSMITLKNLKHCLYAFCALGETIYTDSMCDGGLSVCLWCRESGVLLEINNDGNIMDHASIFKKAKETAECSSTRHLAQPASVQHPSSKGWMKEPPDANFPFEFLHQLFTPTDRSSQSATT